MTKRDTRTDFLSINDFSDKCRICLKNYSEMVDIFASGISNQITELTNIEISSNDKLPRNMCQNCGEQLRELHKFQCLAKESDNYLRALLNSEEVLDQSDENLCLKSVKKKKRKIQGKLLSLKSSQKSKENLGNDKMYLILVTEASNKKSQNEICIKDLDGENENEELTKFCKSLIKNQSSDNSLANDHESVCKTQIDVIENNNARKIHKVNLFIYNCSECEKAFELEELLIEHLRSCHKTELLHSSFSYECPVCVKSERDKNLFMNHLSDHKKDGFSFVKVDRSGNDIPLAQLEEGVFEVPNSLNKSIIRNKIFKMNENCYKCHLCKNIVSVNSVNEHLKICYSNLKDCDLLPHVKYSCPACSESWVDDIESFKLHLPSHRADNVFFVKVDNFGELVSLTEEDIAFTEFEKALEILDSDFGVDEEVSQFHLRKKIVKVLDLFSCLICDFESESITSCSEHYLEVHKDVTIPVAELSCPVCSENFKFIDESVKYLDHLKNHKAEGINFLRIDKNGSFVRKSSDSSGLFTDLNDLFNGRVECSDFISDVYVPEVFLDAPVDGCVCESDHKEFTSKEEIVSHVKMTGANKSNREYVCEKCGRKCFGRGNYRRHFTTHTEKRDSTSGSKRPSCSVCKKTFSNRTSLNEHRKHHAIGDNDGSDGDGDRKICEICGRKLSNNASLAKHRRLHLSNRESSLLKCKICERGFRREPALNRHVSHHLNPNYFECEVCKLPLPSLASLQRHKLWHEGSSNTHDCKVCKLSFLTKDRLTAHQTHTGHHQDRKRFECNVCHERFFVGREFSQHIKLHPKYKMSECSLCGKRLSTMQSLMLHLSRHFESNSILCPHCGKQFFEERNYHRHLLTHKGVKPFSCDFEGCKKSFYTYFELNRHKKYHNNTRDFNCPYCPKSFHEANHLKVHIRTHTGERPYTCPHCNKGFVTRTRCKQHINLIHQGVGCDLIQSNITKKVAVFEALETVA